MRGEISGAKVGGVEITTKDGHLYVDVDLQRPGEPSSSGKSEIVASTRGWLNLGELCAGENFALSFNLIKRGRRWER